MFLQKKTSIGKIIAITALLLSVASFGTMAQTAHLGGLIRHTELQKGNAVSGNEKDGDKTKSEDKTSGTKSPDTQLPDSMKDDDKEKDDDD